jgi:hypothetical protein
VSCPSRFFYSIYIGRETQLINKHSFNLLYFFCIVSERLRSYDLTLLFASVLPLEINWWSVSGSVPIPWWILLIRLSMSFSRRWAAQLASVWSTGHVVATSGGHYRSGLIYMTMQAITPRCTQCHRRGWSMLCTESHVSWWLTKYRSVASRSVEDRSTKSWSTATTRISSGQCSTTGVKLRALKVFTEIQICCCKIFLFTQTLGLCRPIDPSTPECWPFLRMRLLSCVLPKHRPLLRTRLLFCVCHTASMMFVVKPSSSKSSPI